MADSAWTRATSDWPRCTPRSSATSCDRSWPICRPARSPSRARRSGRPPMEREHYRPHPAAFARHSAVVLVVSSALIGLWALTGSGFFWPAIPLIFFGLGLVRHARWGGRRGYYHARYRDYHGEPGRSWR